MNVLGYITLAIFVIAMVLTLLRKINLPVQTVLVLTTLVCLIIGFIFRLFSEEGLTGALLLPNEAIGGIILHPITALLAGLFMAGSLSASKGFEGLKVIINWLRKTPLGLAGTLVIIIQLPVIASLPCGRIIAAALLPLLFTFGVEGGLGILGKAQLVVFIGAFTRNAMGSCGPSPIGGVGQIGEGFLGAHYATASDGILRAPQAFAIFFGTALVAFFLRMVSLKLFPQDISLKDTPKDGTIEKKETQAKAPLRGYVSLILFVASLLIAIFQPFGKLPVQSVLALGAVLIVIVCRVRITDLMVGIILLPVTAMAAGFLAAGALDATGGFAALGQILKALSDIPALGVIGMLTIFVQLQTVMPLSCSRILTAALTPVLYLFGPDAYGLLNWSQLAIVMAAYIVNATTSCGPSPLGGGGTMGEGQMRAETGFTRGAYTFGTMAVMTPLAAVYMKFENLAIFDPGTTEFHQNLWALCGYTAIIIAASLAVIYGISKVITENYLRNWRSQLIGFLVSGAVTGMVIATCLYGFDPGKMAQGLLGSVIAASLIALMAPKTLVPVRADLASAQC